MKSKRIIYIFLSLFVFLQCWKKQHHEITAPEIPRYTISGTIKDIDTDEIIAGSAIHITADSHIAFDDTAYKEVSDTSDTSGYYELEGLPPGIYHLGVKRGEYEVTVETVFLGYRDTTFDIGLPKILISHTNYQFSGKQNWLKYPLLYGLYWKSRSRLAVITQDQSDRWRIIEGNYTSGFSIVGTQFWKENPKLWGLTYLYNYWTCGGTNFDAKLYAIYPGKGYVESEINVSYLIKDLTDNGSNIWATASIGKIIKYGNHPSVIEKIYDFPASNPAGIAWDGENIWTNGYNISTSSSNQNFIYKHDQEMNVEQTFCPIYEDNLYNYFIIREISYLSFDFNGNLWAADGINVYVLEINQ